jgi:hypothetical protein
MKPIRTSSITDNSDYPIFDSTAPNNGSQIIEPQIATNNGGSQNTTIPQNNSGNSTSSNPNAQPSETTGSTKNYVEGGTTPDSNITIKKPKPNYLTLGIIGVIGLLVVYKLFFNKKGK